MSLGKIHGCTCQCLKPSCQTSYSGLSCHTQDWVAEGLVDHQHLHLVDLLDLPGQAWVVDDQSWGLEVGHGPLGQSWASSEGVREEVGVRMDRGRHSWGAVAEGPLEGALCDPDAWVVGLPHHNAPFPLEDLLAARNTCICLLRPEHGHID